MPERETVRKAKQKLKSGKSPTTAAGEFVREEMHHIRQGKHGARSTKQAIAIGLSKARRAGIPLKPPRGGKKRTRDTARRAYAVGQGRRKPRAPSRKRGRAMMRALRREPRAAASHRALSRHAHQVAKQRTRRERSASARKASRTRAKSTRRRRRSR